MPQNPPQTKTASEGNVATKTKQGLSEHAEDTLAHVIGDGLDLDSSKNDQHSKTVSQVLAKSIEAGDDISIMLEFGAGDTGVDQPSWEIEVMQLQRAFARHQHRAELSSMANVIQERMKDVTSRLNRDWISKTKEFGKLSISVRQPHLLRQTVDDFHHIVYGHDVYMVYMEEAIRGGDDGQLLNAAANLVQYLREMEVQRAELVKPESADNVQLAEELKSVAGDVDMLRNKLERNIEDAKLRSLLSEAARLTKIMNQDFLKEFKIWAHNFELNIREVLTRPSESDGQISEESRKQLLEMMDSGQQMIDDLQYVFQWGR